MSKNYCYKQAVTYRGMFPVRVYKHSVAAWNAYHQLKKKGWQICNYNGFENALVKYED